MDGPLRLNHLVEFRQEVTVREDSTVAVLRRCPNSGLEVVVTLDQNIGWVTP